MLNVFGLTIHLYGLLIGLGVWAGLEIALKARPKLAKEAEQSFIWALTFGVIGARIYHVVDYWSRYYSQNLWNIFAVWEGGLGIWGAIVGAILGLYLYCRIKNKRMLPILDSFAVGAPIAQAIGRLGNWANGELIGKNGEPLFAYEATLNVLLFTILWRLAKKKTRNGKLFGRYLAGYGIIRIILEGLRPNEIIWRVGGVPTAIIFGVVGIIIGISIIQMDSRSGRE